MGPTPATRPRAALRPIFLAAAFLGVAVSLGACRGGSTRHELEVLNAGSEAVIAEHQGDEVRLEPGQTWRLQYSRADPVKVRRADGRGGLRLLYFPEKEGLPAGTRMEVRSNEAGVDLRLDPAR